MPHCPINVGERDGYRIFSLVVMGTWEDAIKEGLDPNALVVRCYELGDGNLQVGFKTSEDSPNWVFGRAVSPDFWWCVDERKKPWPWHLSREPR